MRNILEILPRLRRYADRLLHPTSKLIDITSPDSVSPGTLVFQCNVCSSLCAIHFNSLNREEGHCVVCDSNMRFRSIIHHLSSQLFDQSLCISDFPPEAAHIFGIGMSDAGKYAARLSTKLAYENTFYHKSPRLDIQQPGSEHIGAYDFIISSDVLEHVAPPISNAFTNLRSLLKDGGLLVLTVPFSAQGDTVEHFPELYEYNLEKQGREFVLKNRTADGKIQEFSDLVFHGGPGSTLEMRQFSESGLRQELERAGFTDNRFHREPHFENGIYWKEPWSVPITAIASEFMIRKKQSLVMKKEN